MDVLDRITALIRQNGWSEREFLRRLGMNEGALRDWRSGKSSTYKKHLARIAAVLGTTAAYLSGETDNAHVRIEASMASIPVYRDLPAPEVSGAPLEYEQVAVASLEAQACEYAFLLATDDSMAPLILPGDKALILLGKCGEGEKVSAIRIDAGAAVMRRVKQEKTGAIMLNCVNPYYPPRAFSAEESGRVQALGRVVRILRDL